MWHCNCKSYHDNAVDAPTEAGTVWVSRWNGLAFNQWARPTGEIGVPDDVQEAAEDVTPVCPRCKSTCWQGPRPSVDEDEALSAYKVKFTSGKSAYTGRVQDAISAGELEDHYEDGYLSVEYKEYATANPQEKLISTYNVIEAIPP